MRYEKGRKDASRRRIIEVASERFRKEGIAASGIASIMTDAGLTNGAFYPHFESKADLVCECIAEAQEAQSKLLSETLASGGLESLITMYLSPEHRDNPEVGCTGAALLAELARESATTRQRYTKGLLSLAGELAKALPLQVRDPEGVALAAFASLIGTLQMARAVKGAALSDRILAAGADAARAIVQSHLAPKKKSRAGYRKK